MFEYIRTRPLALVSLVVVAIMYFVMIFAEFFAPYSATLSFEKNTFHPSNVQFSCKGILVREFRVVDKSSWRYVRVKDLECVHKMSFFVHGEKYKLFGFIPSDIHLFGSSSEYPVYLLGADNLGRDLFSRIVYGSRISLTIGFVATAISLMLAVILGGISGYFGGIVDWSIMRSAEFFMLIPSMYLILFLRSLLNAQMDSGKAYMLITVILSLVGWPGSARTVRGMVHSIKREEFVMNAALEGIPSGVIIFFHIIPQISSILIVSTALGIPLYIMSETTLSYLGLGISDPAVSWGSLINRDISTVSNLKNFPWLLYPVLMLLVVTLAFNFLGDALRDFYDPYGEVFRRRKNPLKKSKKQSPPDEMRGANIETESEKNAENEAAADNTILSVRNLWVSFDVFRERKREKIFAVKGVNFDLKKGEILGIVGESGSGKSVSTTAILSLTGAGGSVQGKIFYGGTDLASLGKKELRLYRGREIALIFQEPGRSFDPLQTIGGVFLEAFRNVEPEISKADAAKKAISLLEEVGLSDAGERLSAYPHQFSGGQLQRIGIALALAQNCKVLIADEPTTALDVTVQSQIVSLLFRLKEEKSLSIIFISHDINLVAEISDRIAVMYKGKIVELSSSDKIMNEPEHPYTKALLSSVPSFGMHYTKEKLFSISPEMRNEFLEKPSLPLSGTKDAFFADGNFSSDSESSFQNGEHN